MDPEEKIPEIPYHTPERIEDPPGGISYYTPAVSPYTVEERTRIPPTQMRLRTRVTMLLLMMNI